MSNSSGFGNHFRHIQNIKANYHNIIIDTLNNQELNHIVRRLIVDVS